MLRIFRRQRPNPNDNKTARTHRPLVPGSAMAHTFGQRECRSSRCTPRLSFSYHPPNKTLLPPPCIARFLFNLLNNIPEVYTLNNERARIMVIRPPPTQSAGGVTNHRPSSRNMTSSEERRAESGGGMLTGRRRGLRMETLGGWRVSKVSFPSTCLEWCRFGRSQT